MYIVNEVTMQSGRQMTATDVRVYNTQSGVHIGDKRFILVCQPQICRGCLFWYYLNRRANKGRCTSQV